MNTADALVARQATKLADFYYILPSMPSSPNQEKFRAILSGGFNPQTETPDSCRCHP